MDYAAHHHTRHSRAALALALVAILLVSGLAPQLAQRDRAYAQIDNAQPTQPYASIVDCIRPGSDLGAASHASPRFVTTCFGTRLKDGGYLAPGDLANGDADPGDAAIVEFGNATPDGSADLDGAASHIRLATLAEVGSVNGLAFSSGSHPAAPAGAPRHRRLFAAAFTKMQTRFGPGGPGAIYVVDQTSGSVALYATIPNVVPGPLGAAYAAGDGTQATFPNAAYHPTYDTANGGIHKRGGDEYARDLVGTTSLGDLALDLDERFLYTVNLRTRRVYRLDTWSANPQASLTALPPWPMLSDPDRCNASGSDGPSTARPFALLVTRTALSLGYVCSTELSQAREYLRAAVARYDLASGAWDAGNTLIMALASFDTQRSTPLVTTIDPRWRPWRTGVPGDPNANYLVYPEPWLTDLALAEDGALLLGFRDRLGDMTSHQPFGPSARAQGDLLRAVPGGSGWLAPATSVPEFFDDYSAWNDSESAGGGLAYVPGTPTGTPGGTVASSILDPYIKDGWGVGWWNAQQGGSMAAREEIYRMDRSLGTFGKSNGLGDLELLCTWRAVGDRLWHDANGDGVQDAAESDLPGVTLRLYAASDTGFTTPLASVTTGGVSGMSGNWRFYLDPFQAYRVRIDPAEFAAGGTLAGLRPTAANQTGDALDSDADPNGVISIFGAWNTEVNTTFDLGVAQPVNLRLGKSAPATATLGQPLAFTLTYRNDGPGLAAATTIVDTLPSGLTFVSASPAPTTRSGQTLSWSIPSLGVGQNGSITINTTVGVGAPSTLINSAVISTITPENNLADNRAQSITTLNALPANVFVGTSAPATASAGEALAFTLTYGNNGSGPADGVVLVDTLPTGVSFLSASPAPSSRSGQTARWNLGTLAAGALGSITLNTTVSASPPASLTNNAAISTTSVGDDLSDNSDSSTTVIPPNVFIQKDGPGAVNVNNTFSYVLTLGNDGPSSASGVVVQDTLPAGLSFSSATPAPTSVSGQTLSWNLGALTPGQRGSIRLTVLATNAAPASVTNSAQISTTSFGDEPGDNRDSATTQVRRPPAPPAASATFQLRIHSTLDPARGVYHVSGARISWPAGEVLDLTPAVTLAVPPASVPGYSTQGRVVAWSLARTRVNGVERGAQGADDYLPARSGCRARALPTSDPGGLEGCAYRYLANPTAADMAGQAHLFWSVGLPLRMRTDVYVYRLGTLAPAALTLQAQVLIEVVDEMSGLVVASQSQIREATFGVDLVAPRSAR